MKERNYVTFLNRVFVKIQHGLLTCCRSADTQNTTVMHTIVLHGETVKIQIWTNHDTIILALESERNFQELNAVIQRNNERELDDYYTVGRGVATGEHCSVHVATPKHRQIAERKELAIKSIDREKKATMVGAIGSERRKSTFYRN